MGGIGEEMRYAVLRDFNHFKRAVILAAPG